MPFRAFFAVDWHGRLAQYLLPLVMDQISQARIHLYWQPSLEVP